MAARTGELLKRNYLVGACDVTLGNRLTNFRKQINVGKFNGDNQLEMVSTRVESRRTGVLVVVMRVCR